jgi:hypothetical protein
LEASWLAFIFTVTFLNATFEVLFICHVDYFFFPQEIMRMLLWETSYLYISLCFSINFSPLFCFLFLFLLPLFLLLNPSVSEGMTVISSRFYGWSLWSGLFMGIISNGHHESFDLWWVGLSLLHSMLLFEGYTQVHNNIFSALGVSVRLSIVAKNLINESWNWNIMEQTSFLVK